MLSKVELPFALVRLSGLLTEPLVLCTETGWRVRDLGARMYSSYGIARVGASSAAVDKTERNIILQLPIEFCYSEVSGTSHLYN